jgi:beta-N-acetylglucosaminidase
VEKAMTEKELKTFTINYINQKELDNENFIRYTFYELRVKNNLSEDELNTFLRINRDYFENKGYQVYFTNARYEYNGAFQNVQPNELMIAFKNN